MAILSFQLLRLSWISFDSFPSCPSRIYQQILSVLPSKHINLGHSANWLHFDASHCHFSPGLLQWSPNWSTCSLPLQSIWIPLKYVRSCHFTAQNPMASISIKALQNLFSSPHPIYLLLYLLLFPFSYHRATLHSLAL